MLGANLQSLQALVEFRNSLPMLSDTAINEVQEMVLSAHRSVQEAEEALSDCRANLWAAEDTLQDTEESGYEEYSDVEEARTEVAQAESHFSEVQAAYSSFQSIASRLSNRLTVHFANAQNFLDERIEAAKSYQALSVFDTVGISANDSAVQKPRSSIVPSTAAKNHPAASTPAFESGRKAHIEGLDLNSNPYRNLAGRERAADIWDEGWQSESENNADGVSSPLRGESTSALPALPNRMEWVEIDNISTDDVDGVPDNLGFSKVSKENMKEMLETFENQLLPILNENKDVSTNELLTLDKQNAAEDSSSSLRLCHESMIGSSTVSDVIVLHSKPASSANKNHPAANTPAFESGRKARLEGKDQNSNPYRDLAGREGAANIWDQGWQSESHDRALAFTSGRHRALVAQELGWKFIPARVLGEK